MSGMDWLRYSNQSATRRLPLSPDLVNALQQFAPQMGLQVEVFSGGQPEAGGGPRTGSTRHDHGHAADVFFYKDGRRLDWQNQADLPVFQDIVRKGKEAGLTGFGAGPGYMQPGSMHIGFGNPGVWGAGGSSRNAPAWLAEAYGAVAAGKPMPTFAEAMTGAAPTMANMQNKTFDPVGEVMAAGGSQGGSLAALYPGPQAPSMPGTPAGPMSAPMQMAAAPQTFSGLALLFAQQQADRQKQREEERAAEEVRRAALFAPNSLSGLYG
ncbi:MAG: hypothetical protein ACOVN5_07095 [Aquidulcibacter sp.]